MTLRQRIEQLEAHYGNLRKTARALNIDAGYLYRLKTGKKKHPSSWTLRKLGLDRIEVYVLREIGRKL